MFLHGVNYPWSTDGTTVYYGLDFGANVWGSHLGVSTRREAIARDFDRIAALGFRLARWFVFCDGRSGIVFDEAGLPAGLDPHVFVDLDAALEIALAAGVVLDLVLLDHRWVFEGVRETLADPVSGALLEARLPRGRARVLRTNDGRQALFDHVFVPLVHRYGANGARADLAPAVAAYEFMNEPDFVVEEWERDLSSHVASPLRFEELAVCVAALSELVHAETPAFTTIGCARIHNLWAWDETSLGLDVLQIHSYPDLARTTVDVDVYGTPASALGVRRDVILGEFPSDAPNRRPRRASPPPTTLDDYLEFAVRGGYAGAWPWSFSGTDAYGPVPEPPLRRFADKYPELVHPRARC